LSDLGRCVRRVVPSRYRPEIEAPEAQTVKNSEEMLENHKDPAQREIARTDCGFLRQMAWSLL
jgi:hypothetical protein